MIKLVDILKEIYIDEGIVKVPQEILNKSKEAFNYIKSNLEDLRKKSPKNYDQPYIDSKFKDYFKFRDLKNQDLIVSIGFYNDPEDVGAGRMDTYRDILLINLAYFNIDDLEEFEDTIEHELVHAMDPKVRDKKLFGVLYARKGAEPCGSKFNRSLDKSNPGSVKSEFEKNYEKYLKSQGYDHIPYINSVEDRGNVSYLILLPENLRSRWAEFDPEYARQIGLGKNKGGSVVDRALMLSFRKGLPLPKPPSRQHGGRPRT